MPVPKNDLFMFNVPKLSDAVQDAITNVLLAYYYLVTRSSSDSTQVGILSPSSRTSPEDYTEAQGHVRDTIDSKDSSEARLKAHSGITGATKQKATNESDIVGLNDSGAIAKDSDVKTVLTEDGTDSTGLNSITPAQTNTRISADYPFRCNGTGGHRWIRRNAEELETMVKLKDYTFEVIIPSSETRDAQASLVLSAHDKAQVVITQKSCAKAVRNTFDVYVTGATIYHHSLYESPKRKSSKSGGNVCKWTVTLPRLNPGQHSIGVVLDYLGDRAVMEPHKEAFPAKDYITICSDASLAAVGRVDTWQGLFAIRDKEDEFKTINIPHCALGLEIGTSLEVQVTSTTTTADQLPPMKMCSKGENPGKWVHHTAAPRELVGSKYDLEPHDDYIWTPFTCMYERQTLPALIDWANKYPDVNQTSGLKIAFFGDSVMEQIRYHVNIELNGGELPERFFEDKYGHVWHKPDIPFTVYYREFFGVYTKKFGEPCAPGCPRHHIGIPNLVVRLVKEYLETNQPNIVVIGSLLHDLMQSTLEDYRNVDPILSYLNSWALESPSRRVVWMSGTAIHNGLRFKMFRTTTRVEKANDIVQDFIARNNYDRIEYMDIYHMTLSRPDRSYDGIHYTLRIPKPRQESRHTDRAMESNYCDGDWFDQQMYRQLDFPDSLVRTQARMLLDTLLRIT